jgi:hypothetical protein
VSADEIQRMVEDFYREQAELPYTNSMWNDTKCSMHYAIANESLIRFCDALRCANTSYINVHLHIDLVLGETCFMALLNESMNSCSCHISNGPLTPQMGDFEVRKSPIWGI